MQRLVSESRPQALSSVTGQQDTGQGRPGRMPSLASQFKLKGPGLSETPRQSQLGRSWLICPSSAVTVRGRAARDAPAGTGGPAGPAGRITGMIPAPASPVTIDSADTHSPVREHAAPSPTQEAARPAPGLPAPGRRATVTVTVRSSLPGPARRRGVRLRRGHPACDRTA
jgi:hypothetical protein